MALLTRHAGVHKGFGEADRGRHLLQDGLGGPVSVRLLVCHLHTAANCCCNGSGTAPSMAVS